MNDIAKVSDVKSVAINTRRDIVLSVGQQRLMSLLIQKCKKEEIISKQDIIDFYVQNISGAEYQDPVYDYIRNQSTQQLERHFSHYKVRLRKEDWNIWSKARQWFVSNLGICIIKGKLIAIPVIETD